MEQHDGTPTRQRNRRGQGARLRDDILAAGTRLLSEGGESAVTIRAVTRAAGIAPQSFYLQFATLGELLFALYRAGHERLHERLATAAGNAAPGKALTDVVRAYLRFARDEPALYRTLMDTPGGTHPEWDPQGLPGADSLELIRDAVAESRPELAPDPQRLFVATTLVWTGLHGIASLTINRPAFPWPDTDVLLDRLLEGIAG